MMANSMSLNGDVSPSVMDAQLNQIMAQANALVSLGVPSNYTDSFVQNATAQIANSNSPYYTAGLSTLGNTSSSTDPDGRESLDHELARYGINTPSQANNDPKTFGVDIRPSVSDLKNWTVSRVAVTIVGIIMLAIGLISITTKDAVSIIADNPELLTGV